MELDINQHNPYLSVIVLNYNGKEHLYDCLNSLKKQTYPHIEVILVDNGSTDGSCSYVREAFPWVRLIENKRNLGFSGGNNIGIRNTKSNLVILLNNDTRTEKTWAENIVIFMKDNPTAGACGCKLVSWDGKFVDYEGGWFSRLGYGGNKGFMRKVSNSRIVAKQTFFGCGAALVLRKDILRQIGGLDEDFLHYYEDVDLCWRIWLAGYQVIFCPMAIVYHKGSATLGSGTSYTSSSHINDRKAPTEFYHWYNNPTLVFRGGDLLKNYFLERNSLFSMIKNLEAKNLWLILFSFAFRLVITFLKFYSGNSKISFVKLKAYWTIIRDFKKIWYRRLIVQSRRVVKDDLIFQLFDPSSQYIHEVLRSP